MTFTFTNYAGIEPQASPYQDMIGKILGGYTDMTKARYLQPGLEEELKKAKLHNQYYGPNIESQIGLRGAQAGQAKAHTGLLGQQTLAEQIKNRYLAQQQQAELDAAKFKLANPLFNQTGTSGDLGRLLYLRDMIKNNPELAGQLQNQPNKNIPEEGGSYIPSFGNKSPQNINPEFDFNKALQDAFVKVAQGKDKQFAPSNLGKLQQEYAKAQSGINPFTNEKFENEQQKAEFLAPYSEKLAGLKQGEHYVYDPETHDKIGVQKPYTPKEHDEEAGRAFFNEVFPVINNGFKDFIGKDSVKHFNYYANNYGKDPISTQKIDDLLLAEKLISAGVVKEAATLGAGKTNQTYKNLTKSFPQSDIPALIQRYGKEFKLPSSAFVKSGVRFQDFVNQAQNISNNSVPALKTVYFHPEKHLKSKEEVSKALEHHEETVTIKNKKTGKTETVSKAEAKKRGIKNV